VKVRVGSRRWCRRHVASATRSIGVGSALGLVGVVLAACGTSLLATTNSTSAPTTPTTVAATSTTVPLTGEVAVAFPVVRCASTTSGYGAGAKAASGGTYGNQGWKPTILLAPIPTALVGKVEFYSDGIHTVVGPTGWTCSALPGSQGTDGLVVYPSNNPNPPISGMPPAGTEGIFATFDTTGHAQGVALVCPFSTVATWQQKEANCSTTKPAGEQTSMLTPDIASVSDTSGSVGSLIGSGGVQPVSGMVIFPQVQPAVSNGSSVNVAVESCSLTDSALCPTILSDFVVREFPVPTSPTTSGH
jgi:hypothetical protein